jgi:hypothetical protein
MRRIDVIGLGIGLFAGGGLLYVILQLVGLDSISAGIWSQAFLVGGLILWLLSYLWRVMTNDMTYHQQVNDYEKAFFQKQLEKMTPAEIEKIAQEIEQESSNK